MQRKIHKGDKYGKWIVLEKFSNPINTSKIKCICTGCEKEYKVMYQSLIYGRSTQCVTCSRRSVVDYLGFVGKKVGEWTVIKYLGFVKNKAVYTIRCSCGREYNRNKGDIRVRTVNGKERGNRCRVCSNRITSTKHGYSRTKIYKVWSSMLSRCNTVSSSSYESYGARGITVSKDWHKFENFIKDMGDRLSEGLSIDRIDNSKGYSKENCRWATKRQQANNTRSNVHITLKDKVKTVSEFARYLNINRSRLDYFLRNHPNKSLSDFIKYINLSKSDKNIYNSQFKSGAIELDGIGMSLKHWGRKFDISKSTLKLLLTKYSLSEVQEITSNQSKKDVNDTIKAVNKKSYRLFGMDKTAHAWSTILKISRHNIDRIFSTMSESEIIDYIKIEPSKRGAYLAKKKLRIHKYNKKLYTKKELAIELNAPTNGFSKRVAKFGLDNALAYYIKKH